MRRIMWFLTIALAAGVLAAAGCGDDEEEGNGGAATEQETPAATEEPTEEPTPTEEAGGGGGGDGGGETLTLTADPGGAISWEPAELNAAAGSVTIELVNDSDVPHAVEVEGNGVEEESETITGSTTELTVDLEPGEYVFYCPVGQHRQNGMEGQLLVE
jgi:plastocyanin